MSSTQKALVSKITATPVSRACEVLETTRNLLKNKKRWTKGILTNSTHTAFCLHGAVTYVGGGDEKYPTYVNEYSNKRVHAAGSFLLDAIHQYINRPENMDRFGPGPATYDLRQEVAKSIARNNKRVEENEPGGSFMAIAGFNDHKDTTHDDIKAVLKLARELCYDLAAQTEDLGGEGF